MSLPPSSPALLVTGDPRLRGAVDRLAAAAGASPAAVADAATALARWRDAPMVLVGADLLAAIAGEHPVRRERVHVVTLDSDDDGIFRDALAVGAESVLELPAADAWLVEALADTVETTGRPARLIGVVGGSGGVGASTLAAALAVTAARAQTDAGRSLPALLVDADPLGGGLDRIMGLESAQALAGPASAPSSAQGGAQGSAQGALRSAPGTAHGGTPGGAHGGTHWGRLAESAGRLGTRALSEGLPRAHGVGVLAWGPGRRPRVDPVVVREVVDAARRASGVVVADLARHPEVMSRELLARCDALVVVSGCSVSATAACARVLDVCACPAPTHLVVRAGGAGVVAEEVAEALGLPLRAVLGRQRGLDELVDLGLGPVRSARGPLARTCRSVLAAVGERPPRSRRAR